MDESAASSARGVSGGSRTTTALTEHSRKTRSVAAHPRSVICHPASCLHSSYLLHLFVNPPFPPLPHEIILSDDSSTAASLQAQKDSKASTCPGKYTQPNANFIFIFIFTALRWRPTRLQKQNHRWMDRRFNNPRGKDAVVVTPSHTAATESTS